MPATLSDFQKNLIDEKLKREGPKAMLEQALATLETDARAHLKPREETVLSIRYVISITQGADGLLGLWSNTVDALAKILLARHALVDLPGYKLALDVVNTHLKAAESMQAHGVSTVEAPLLAANIRMLRLVIDDLRHPSPETLDQHHTLPPPPDDEVCASVEGRCVTKP